MKKKLTQPQLLKLREKLKKQSCDLHEEYGTPLRLNRGVVQITDPGLQIFLENLHVVNPEADDFYLGVAEGVQALLNQVENPRR